MKRIIFYAAAVGIFVSSVLAKPARGAAPVCAGSTVSCGDAGRLLTELLSEEMNGGNEWAAGGRNWNGQCGNIWGTASAVEASGNGEGAEWFPGQGPEMNQLSETQSPETQSPESQPPQTQAQGTEWFPGQGPGMNQPSETQSPESQPPQAQDQGAEWFPGQGPEMAQKPDSQLPDTQKPDSQLPDIQIPWTEWFPWLNGQNGNFWQQGSGSQGGGAQNGGQNDFWWSGGGSDSGNNGGTQSGGQNGGTQSGGQNGGTQSGGQNGGTQSGGQNSGSQSGGAGAMASYITRIVELVNIQRAAAGLSPVTASAALSSAADVRAREIVGNFSHYRPNGTYFNTVLDQRNISYNGAGENIAYGYDTPERVMTEWMNSASHRANILDGRYTKLGVGYYEQGGVKYWTQLFTY